MKQFALAVAVATLTTIALAALLGGLSDEGNGRQDGASDCESFHGHRYYGTSRTIRFVLDWPPKLSGTNPWIR